ncbi:putative MFS family arabinose efflux permease [Actinomycetospora succinea]|uniref:Putative MFS family arabinose efflux permease n=1 Tax=Actinomycetospora succinea TaxID=663603 RepID=A0A4R6UZ17_9PSEU|nr:MFS transporter [Actinomycetospora succinea]TDQ50855.1 putative MFS family arabinose efflux permease [Actinomycetospora succinea]
MRPTEQIAPTSERPRTGLSPGRTAFACMIGTLVEIYDFILYTFVAALVFGPLFFPGAQPWLGTLAALSSHAVAFFVRPLGAWVFGRLGDRWGRRGALVLSLSLMGVASAGVGLLPTYAAIGIAAPVLLVVLRLVQGLAVGGEWGGAVAVAVEHAPPSRRVLYGSLPQVGSVLGLALAAASLLVVASAVDEETFLAWGWRVPFLAGFVLVALGMFVRLRLEETPDFKKTRDEVPATFAATMREAGRPILAVTLAWLSIIVVVYALMTGLLAYAKSYVEGIDAHDVQVGLVLCGLLLVPYTIGAALLAKKVSRERLVLVAGLFTIVWAFPAFGLVATGEPALLWVAMAIGVIPYGLGNGALPSLMSDAFPVRLRYTGVAVSFALANVIGGALLPLPALALVATFGGSSVPLAIALVLGGIASVVGVAMLRRLPRYPAGSPGPELAESSTSAESR